MMAQRDREMEKEATALRSALLAAAAPQPFASRPAAACQQHPNAAAAASAAVIAANAATAAAAAPFAATYVPSTNPFTQPQLYTPAHAAHAPPHAPWLTAPHPQHPPPESALLSALAPPRDEGEHSRQLMHDAAERWCEVSGIEAGHTPGQTGQSAGGASTPSRWDVPSPLRTGAKVLAEYRAQHAATMPPPAPPAAPTAAAPLPEPSAPPPPTVASVASGAPGGDEVGAGGSGRGGGGAPRATPPEVSAELMRLRRKLSDREADNGLLTQNFLMGASLGIKLGTLASAHSC